MPDAEHGGPGSGNQDGSGAGSGHGSGGDQTGDYGGQGEFDGLGGNTSSSSSSSSSSNSGNNNSVGAGTGRNENNPAKGHSFDGFDFGGLFGGPEDDANPSFDPSAAPVGVGTNQNLANQQNFNSFDSTVDAIDTDYGYYDGVTVTNQTPAYDPANVESQVMGQTQQNPSYSQPQHALDAIAEQNLSAQQTNPSFGLDDNGFISAPVAPARTSLDQDMASTSPQSPQNRNLTNSHVQAAVNSIRNINNPREKAKAIKEFMDKNKVGLRNLAIKNAKEYDIGLLGYVPGIGLMNMIGKGMRALAEKMGLQPGVNTPAMNALEQAARQAGVMDKETGEYTVEEMRATCNGMQGYRWDEGSQSCMPIQQDAETGAINPYNGMISSP
jgi:hypothetical protein